MLAGLALATALGAAPVAIAHDDAREVDGACVPTDLGWVDGRLTVVAERGLTVVGVEPADSAPRPAPTGSRLTGAPEDPPGGPWLAFTTGGTTTISGRERSWTWSGDPPGFDAAVARLPFAAAADLGRPVGFAVAPSGGAPIGWLASPSLVTRVALWSEPYATEVWALPLDRRPILDLVWVDKAQVFAILTGPSADHGDVDSDSGVVFAWRPGLTPLRWGALPAGPAPVALAVAMRDPTVGAQAYVVHAAADPEACSAGTAPPAAVSELALPPLPDDLAVRTGPGFATVGPGCAPPPVPRVIVDGLPEVARPWREICGATLSYERVTVSPGAWRGPCEIQGHDLVIDGAAAPIDGPVTVTAARTRLERITVRHEVGAAGITLRPGTEGGQAVVDSVVTVGGPSNAGIRVDVTRGAALVVIANDKVIAGAGGDQPFDGIQVDVREHALLSGLWVAGNTITGRPGGGGGAVRITGDVDRYVVQNNTIAPGFAVGISAGVRPTLGRPGGDPHHGFVVANAIAPDPDSDAATGIAVDGIGQTCIARNRISGALVGVRIARPKRADGRELWLSDNRVVGLGADVSGFVYDSHPRAGVLRGVSAAGNRAELGVRDGTVGVVIDRRKKRFAALTVHDSADAATTLEARRWFADNGVVVEPLQSHPEPTDAAQEAP